MCWKHSFRSCSCFFSFEGVDQLAVPIRVLSNPLTTRRVGGFINFNGSDVFLHVKERYTCTWSPPAHEIHAPLMSTKCWLPCALPRHFLFSWSIVFIPFGLLDHVRTISSEEWNTSFSDLFGLLGIPSSILFPVILCTAVCPKRSRGLQRWSAPVWRFRQLRHGGGHREVWLDRFASTGGTDRSLRQKLKISFRCAFLEVFSLRVS